MNGWFDNADQWLDVLGPNPYVHAVALILIFLVIAKIVDKILCGMVRRLVARTSSSFDDRLIDLLHRPIFTTIAIIGLSLATYQLDLNSRIESITMAILQTIVIVLWLRFALAFSTLLIDALGREQHRFTFAEKHTLPLLRNLAIVVVILAGAYSILLAWDINVTGLVASAGIVGLALSFAAQDTLGHLFAGVAILADRPYHVGDYIVLDSGERGEVTHIGLRSTRLLTRDDVEVTVPNGVMGSAKIVNESGGPHEKFRVRVKVGVAYGTDIDKVIEILDSVARNHDEVCKTPEPRVRFRTFGESGLDFELLAWVEQPVLRGRVVHELNYEVYQEFNRAGVQIPFPQRDLYIKEMPKISSS
jgi:small-conductance mechanosensitive channel